MRIAPATNHARQHRPQRSPQCVRPTGVIIGAEWLPIFLSALASGLLSLLISDVYYRVSVRSADRHHIEQLKATAKRHAEQMERMATPSRRATTRMAYNAPSGAKGLGSKAARDEEVKLTSGLHHPGQFIAPPCIATSAVANDLSSPVQDGDDPRWRQQPRTKKDRRTCRSRPCHTRALWCLTHGGRD
jgi:hypothetical protein